MHKINIYYQTPTQQKLQTKMNAKTIKISLAALLLLTQAACSAPQSSPSMVDYSYVPPSQGVSVVSAPGIQDF